MPRISLRCYQRLEQRLSQTQRLGLKHLLLLKHKLKHPEYPNAVKGWEGMRTAHQILQEREASGVLIGGLSEAVWNQRRKPADLYQHKDVDVAVMDDHFELTENFEGGIDWWLPHRGNITIKSGYGKAKGIEKTWYQNGNGVVLSFGMQKNSLLKPGLYIPDSEWVVTMRVYEADANIDYNKVEAEFDDDVFEKFQDKLRERIKTRLPQFIREAFAGYILSDKYEQDYRKINAVRLENFNLSTIRTIRGLENEAEEKE